MTMEGQLLVARVAASLPIANQFHSTIREIIQLSRPNYKLVGSIPIFNRSETESLDCCVQRLDDVAVLRRWSDDTKLQVAKRKLAGSALKCVSAED